MERELFLNNGDVWWLEKVGGGALMTSEVASVACAQFWHRHTVDWRETECLREEEERRKKEREEDGHVSPREEIWKKEAADYFDWVGRLWLAHLKEEGKRKKKKWGRDKIRPHVSVRLAYLDFKIQKLLNGLIFSNLLGIILWPPISFISFILAQNYFHFCPNILGNSKVTLKNYHINLLEFWFLQGAWMQICHNVST